MVFTEFKTNPMFVQGPGALYEIRRLTHHLGERFLIVTACGPITDQAVAMVKQSFDNPMADNCQKMNMKYKRALAQAQKYDAQGKKPYYEFMDCEGWQVTKANIAKVAERAKEMKADVLIGIGGGKALDMVRGAHHIMGAKVALCPTVAASNAAATTLNVVYNDEGSQIVEAGIMEYHPNLLLADTSLLIQAPPHMLVAGIGDCIGSALETDVATMEHARRHKVLDISYWSNELTKQIFYEHGYAAVKAAEAHELNFSFESVIAQIVHINGPQWGIQNTDFAHILDNALLCFPSIRKMLHGYVIGYACVPLLVYRDAPLEEMYKYVDFAKSIGLPVTLEEIGLADVTEAEFREPAQIAVNSVTYAISDSLSRAEDYYRCMKVGDNIVRDYLAKKK
ncbi:MAG: iron-containing alcohol dehydrogenase [Clostridia bacterium]|nr:iron-containing alcohol dehydrogenase [Clostridia bacterium]